MGEELVGDCIRLEVAFNAPGTSGPRCDPCDNAPEGARYIARGSCEWECRAGRRLTSGGLCERCTEVCGTGQYVPAVCADCVDCTNRVSNSTYSGGGSLGGNDCDFECDDLHSYNEQTRRCELCPVIADCVRGEYLEGTCTSTLNTRCADCTNELPANSYYSGTGSADGTCPYLCDEEFYDPGNGACERCTVVNNCERGQSLVGMCSQDGTPTCEPCVDIPPNATPIDLECSWMCNERYHQDISGRACIPCVTECTVGRYLTGQCMEFTMTSCTLCDNGPANSTYTSVGARDGNNCEFLCDDRAVL